MDTIRVGMINCDLHAMYYACLMADHDPIALRDDAVYRGHAAYFYFYMHYNDPARMTAPFVGGFTLSKLWDPDPNRTAAIQAIWNDNPTICDTIEQACEDVDLVFIGDCNGDGSEHLEWARPALTRGVPTFVDKPFASDIDDARQMVELARQHNAPLYSSSILYEVPQARYFRRRLREIQPVSYGTIVGGGPVLAGQVHAISLALRVFGGDIQSVLSYGDVPLGFIHVNYNERDDKPAFRVTLACEPGGGPHASMYASAYGAGGAILSEGIGDMYFPWGAARILRNIQDMVRTGRPPLSYDKLLEPVAVISAARKSHGSGSPVGYELPS